MGKKGSWLSVLKKVFSSKKTTPKDEVRRSDNSETFVSLREHITPSVFLAPTPPDSCPPSPPSHHVERVKLTEAEDEENQHFRSAECTDDATTADISVPEACASEVVHFSSECTDEATEADILVSEDLSVEHTDETIKADISVPEDLSAECPGEATELNISVPEDLFTEHTGEAIEAADISVSENLSAEHTDETSEAANISVPEDLSAECTGEATKAADISIPEAAEADNSAREAFDLEVVQPKSLECYSGKSEEEIAAIRIQTTFRGFLARRTFRALKSLARLKDLIGGRSVKRQSTSSLKSMQAHTRMQSRIQASRARMAEENKALQRQLRIKNDKELEKSVEEWDDSRQSKEQIEANLLQKQEAALRRQKALAYASSHQKRRNSFKLANTVSTDSSHPEWGWNWLENWMASRPWDSQSMDAVKKHVASVKRVNKRTTSTGEISRFSSPSDLNLESKPSCSSSTTQTSSRPPRHQNTSTTSKVPSTTRKSKPISRTRSDCKDANNVLATLFKRNRSKSLTSSDMEGLVSSSSATSFKTPSSSAKVKSSVITPQDKKVATRKASVGSTKRQLSFSASPSEQRRHSGPLLEDAVALKD